MACHTVVCFCLLLLPSCIVFYLDATATVIFPAEFLKMYDDGEKVFTSNLGNTANTITQLLQYWLLAVKHGIS